MWEPISHSTLHWLNLSELIYPSHTQCDLKNPSPGTERGNSDPAWAVPWVPMGLAGIPRGLLSEVPLRARALSTFFLLFLSLLFLPSPSSCMT